MDRIYMETLEDYGACSDMVAAFTEVFPEAEFPDGVEVNEENLVRAIEGGLDVYWLFSDSNEMGHVGPLDPINFEAPAYTAAMEEIRRIREGNQEKYPVNQIAVLFYHREMGVPQYTAEEREVLQKANQIRAAKRREIEKIIGVARIEAKAIMAAIEAGA